MKKEKKHLNFMNKYESWLKWLIFLAFTGLIFTFGLKAGVKKELFIKNPLFLKLSIIYGIFVFINLPYRALLFFLYKNPDNDNDFEPVVSVVIPAYNEGNTVRLAIDSVACSNYPKDKLEIFCVNDGSRDDTLYWMKQSVERLKGVDIHIINFEKNLGKRQAIYAAYRKAKGSVLITVDSDTQIDPDAIRNLVAPLKDEKIGATTGKVVAYNKNSNFMTRMLGVRYTMAFDFYRSSRSTFKTVFVCSGVLSAYRMSVLDKIMDEWVNQKFLGETCTYGDDRSMTNFVIRNGYYTLYVRNAVAKTIVPERLGKLIKMILRWNKSFIRESLIFAGFMFKPYRKKNRFLPVFDFLISICMSLMQLVILGATVMLLINHTNLILNFLAAIALMGFFYMLFYIKLEKNSDYVYGVVYAFLFIFVLIWTLPYAAITLKNQSWLTR